MFSLSLRSQLWAEKRLSSCDIPVAVASFCEQNSPREHVSTKSIPIISAQVQLINAMRNGHCLNEGPRVHALKVYYKYLCCKVHNKPRPEVAQCF